MKRLLRRLVLAVLLLGTSIALALVAVLFLTPRDQIVPKAVTQFQAATGLKVEISDAFEPQIWPIPGWRLGPVSISDPSAPGQPLLTAGDALLTVAPRGLAQRNLRIGALWLQNVEADLPTLEALSNQFSLPAETPYVSFLRLRDATMRLPQDTPEISRSTHVQLDFAALDYAGAKRPLRLRGSGIWKNRRIEGSARFTSPDRAARGDWVFTQIEARIDGEPLSFSGRFIPDLTQDIPTVAGTIAAETTNPAGAISWFTDTRPNATLVNLRDMTLDGRIETLPERLLLRTRMTGAFRGKRVSLETTLESGPGWFEQGTGTLTAVSRSGGLYSAYLKGSYAREHGVSGDLSLSVLDLPGMVAAGMVPEGVDLSAATNGSLKGRLSATTDGLALADAYLLLGGERYTGDFALDLRGARPIVSLGTSFATLDVAPWIEALNSGARPMSRLLPSLDADLVLEISADQLQLGTITSGEATFTLQTLTEATKVDLRRLDMFGGTLSGMLSRKTNSTRVSIELLGAEIDAAAALAAFDLSGIAGILGGTLRGELPVNVAEDGWKQAAADGELSLFQGRVEGLDLRNNNAAADAATPFTQLDLDLSLDAGKLAIEQISMADRRGKISGSGSIDLVDRALFFELTLDEVIAVVRVAGTLDEPEIIVAAATAETDTEASGETPTAEQKSVREPEPEAQPETDAEAEAEAEDEAEAEEIIKPEDIASEEPNETVQIAESVSSSNGSDPETAASESTPQEPEVSEIDPDATGPPDSPLPPRARR